MEEEIEQEKRTAENIVTGMVREGGGVCVWGGVKVGYGWAMCACGWVRVRGTWGMGVGVGGRVRGGKSGNDGCNRGWNQLLSSTTHTIFRSKRNDLRTNRHADRMEVHRLYRVQSSCAVDSVC